MSQVNEEDGILDGIDYCLASCGQPDFPVSLAELARSLGSSQLMVFDLAQDRESCLVSASFSQLRLGEVLALRYLDGWFRQDPLLPRLLALVPGNCEVAVLGEPFLGMPADYRELFYRQPGLCRKHAVLIAGKARRLAVYLYEGLDTTTRIAPGLARTIGRMVLMHFEGLASSVIPSPLTVLSPRESEVCLGVLAGKKAEVIAGEIGVSVATIATYRRRAYEKLGISSRGALFALCR